MRKTSKETLGPNNGVLGKVSYLSRSEIYLYFSVYSLMIFHHAGLTNRSVVALWSHYCSLKTAIYVKMPPLSTTTGFYMDWNWFFSSLSQSAAAIVGIFGAFIITKILTNQAAFLEKKSRLKELIASAKKISTDVEARYFGWYNKHSTTREFDKLNDLLEQGAEEDAEGLYEKLHFSPFIERASIISQIETVIAERNEAKERERRKIEERLRQQQEAHKRIDRLGIFGQLGGPGHAVGIAMPVSHSIIPSGFNIELNSKLGDEREEIDRLIRECQHHMRLISDFRDSITGNPESSPQITFTLAMVTVLFYIGVIYPLSFMPLVVNSKIELSFAAFWDLLFSIKGGLLGAVALIFSVVLAMFLRMNSKMKYAQTELEELKKFSSLGGYSQYFSVMEANRAASKAKKDMGKQNGEGNDA